LPQVSWSPRRHSRRTRLRAARRQHPRRQFRRISCPRRRQQLPARRSVPVLEKRW